jgi:arsenate reductase
VRVHWGHADPSNAPEAQRAETFERTRKSIAAQMARLLELPLDDLDDAELASALASIAHD